MSIPLWRLIQRGLKRPLTEEEQEILRLRTLLQAAYEVIESEGLEDVEPGPSIREALR